MYACGWVLWALILWCVFVCVVWQTYGWAPLYVASEEGHVQVVRALVEAGAPLNQADVGDHCGDCCCCSCVRE